MGFILACGNFREEDKNAKITPHAKISTFKVSSWLAEQGGGVRVGVGVRARGSPLLISALSLVVIDSVVSRTEMN